MTEILHLEGEIDPFTEADQLEADTLSRDMDKTLEAIKGGELRLATSYAHLGSLLLKIQSRKHWITWGYESWGKYIDYVRERLGRSRAQVYNVLSVAERLLPSISEVHLEQMGISKAQELARFVKQSGRVVPQHLLEKAIDPKVAITELHVDVLEELHEKHDPKGQWFSFGGAYLLVEEKKEIQQAIELAKRVDPPIPHDQPEHIQIKEVFLRWAREFYSSNIAEFE